MHKNRNNLTCLLLFPCLCLFWLFVPLTTLADQAAIRVGAPSSRASAELAELIFDSSEAFTDINSANLHGLLERIGDSQLVLLGEASHGTAEFYDMRARITSELIKQKGFTVVAVEADWPDAESMDYYIHGAGPDPLHIQPVGRINSYVDTKKPFRGFPQWMWANHSMLAFASWLKEFNRNHVSTPAQASVHYYGLDLYNIFSSINAVLSYLQRVDPAAAHTARRYYDCLMPWYEDPALYSRFMKSGRNRGCEDAVLAVLQMLRKNRLQYRGYNRYTGRQQDSRRYFSALQNARLVTNGERYYRTMYQANSNSWNQRDSSMFETLQAILNYHGETAKVVVWAHNSHIGDARATDMAEHGQYNLGQLVRETYTDSAYLVGFGTDHGTVMGAAEWGGEMQLMQVPASHKDSYEYLFHQVKANNFLLPLRTEPGTGSRHPELVTLREKLLPARLARAIGTMYDPENEFKKHYYKTSLPGQFDEYIWFDETHAVKPLNLPD